MRRLVVGVMVAGGLVLTGCSSDGDEAPPAVQSATSALASAADSFASAAASAEAAASSALASVKGGLDARGDVSLGSVATDSDGKASVPVTVTNGGSEAYRYTIQITFEDGSGKLLDATAVNIPDVAAGTTAQATARSNRKLDGTVTAKVGAALRY